MSNIYYPESWMQHPEVLRLQQRVRELEQENSRLKEANAFCLCSLESDKARIGGEEFKNRVAETRLKEAKEEIQKLEQQIETFNQLSFIRKATFQFKID